MQYNLLGKTGMNVSRIGFGGIPIQHVGEDEVKKIVSKCIEAGINFFDTARGYTVSEELLGKAFQGKRDKVYIATKTMARDRDGMMSEVEISLKNLQIDYIDLYQFHNVGSLDEYDKIMGKGGAYEALEKFQEEGVVRHIGITSHKLPIMEKALETECFATIQFPFSVVERQAEEIFKIAHEKNIGTIAMKPMAGGALRDGRKALKFILESPYLSIAIPGMDSLDQVSENAEAADGIALTEDERSEIVKVAKELGNTFCRRCGYCMPCPQGVDIPIMFLMEGYYSRYDLKDWAVTRYNNFKVKADACKKCGICETRCPYELPIRDMLEKVTEVFK
ncbi:aldo/keto reductase [Lutispora sp.]|uniref:aldo/keto reductase n=1 Tax=Lutispora sp. TaxID=2828727 RepID=UPI002B20DC55|nr:aldo/keto reductase [Lutispora sp.]MEA4962487.1 aldo/keto reductase [Lutispora sp.]